MKKKISKENTIMAAILTESGAPFNEEGVDYVKNMIVEKHPELKGRPIIAMMGETVYEVHKLQSLLQANPETFVAVSCYEGQQITLYRPGESPELMHELELIALTEQRTSWQVFTGEGEEE